MIQIAGCKMNARTRYYRCSDKNAAARKLAEVYSTTNDPNFGTLMEVNGGNQQKSLGRREAEPAASELRRLW
eukprot:11217629-Lingulodinium_polyedra.AAC.1